MSGAWPAWGRAQPYWPTYQIPVPRHTRDTSRDTPTKRRTPHRFFFSCGAMAACRGGRAWGSSSRIQGGSSRS